MPEVLIRVPRRDPSRIKQVIQRAREVAPRPVRLGFEKGAVAIVQLGKYGDIINILPILLHIHNSYRTPYIVVSREFADILDAVPYAIPVPVDLDYGEVDKAVEIAQGRFEHVIKTQVTGNGQRQRRFTNSFNAESWRVAGMTPLFGESHLVPVFDHPPTKDLSGLRKTGRPLILTNLTSGKSSPFERGQVMLEAITRRFKHCEVIDIAGFKAPLISDLVQLFDQARVIVSTDTATLHLAAASPTPLIALVNPDDWAGSAPRRAFRVFKYDKAHEPEVCAAISDALAERPYDIAKVIPAHPPKRRILSFDRIDEATDIDILVKGGPDFEIHPDLDAQIRYRCSIWGCMASRACVWNPELPIPIGKESPAAWADLADRGKMPQLGPYLFAFTKGWWRQHGKLGDDQTILRAMRESVQFHEEPCWPVELEPGWTAVVYRNKTNGFTGKTFYHSGDLGDVIYSLPLIRAFGGGIIVLGPQHHPSQPARERMTLARAAQLFRLLKIQPYVTDAYYAESSAGADLNVNDFREEMIDFRQLDLEPGMNLARVPLHHWGVPLDADKDPWLRVPPKKVASVVIARSPRYHNSAFDWKRILASYPDITFIGSRQEHADFCAQFGHVRYTPTVDLYEAAQVISGADLFVGNQSCPFALAIGLGKPVILEDCPGGSNCLFDRPNFIVGCNKDTELPTLGNELVIAAPVEGFTGYGQFVQAVLLRMNHLGIKFVVKPTDFTEHWVSVPGLIKSRISNHSIPQLLISPLPNVDDRLQAGQVLVTMWETDQIDRRTVDAINSRAVCLIVPCQWNAGVFAAAGVRVPIRVVRLGVDRSIYHYVKPVDSRKFVFGTAGRIAHSGNRKGIEETIECFKSAFKNEKDVELRVKIFDDCRLADPNDKRIKVTRKFLDNDAMVKWYAELNCFVSMTKGEGWGLHIHQSMVTGRPVIAPRHGGQSEFLGYHNSLCLKYRVENGVCIPDQEHCIELMRYAYRHRLETAALGKEASLTSERFNLDATTDGIIAVLREFGKL